MKQKVDIFCKIIDNFGDIGVCWRLSKQLVNEHHLEVTLWVDDLATAQKLIKQINLALTEQTIEGVKIHLWPKDESAFESITPADVVIEAFACELPQPYIQNMVAKKPVWLNLEYLSAEKWVDDFHVQSSIHPATGLKKTFFFPGFTLKTGGLVREGDLSISRASFKTTEFWQKLDISPPNSAIKVSLFCYPHAPINSLLTSMAQGLQAIHCFIPNTSILPIVAKHVGKTELKVGETASQGQLSITVLPFLTQADYDELLWACDLNFVRGEDSWIRALWSAKPFVWQPYRQDDDLHITKLNASFDVYAPNHDAILKDFHLAWLSNEITPQLWNALCENLSRLQKCAEKQTHEFEKQADLAANLVIFSKNRV